MTTSQLYVTIVKSVVSIHRVSQAYPQIVLEWDLRKVGSHEYVFIIVLPNAELVHRVFFADILLPGHNQTLNFWSVNNVRGEITTSTSFRHSILKY
jgi:hypothetical protein